AISGGSATSFISGPVKWTMPTNLASGSSYIYPVGKGSTYLPFTLLNPTTAAVTTPTAQVEAFNTNSSGTFDATLSALSSTEYWSLVTTGSFTNSTVSASRPTAIAPKDVLAGNATAANGSYTNLLGTGSTYGVTNSNSIGTNRFFAFAQGTPLLTLSTSSLSGFSYPLGTGPSSEQTFTIRANSLATNITITPSTNYEISTASGGSFVATNPITLNISGGAVPVTTIYVRLKAGLAAASYNSEVISAVASGATTKTVTCSGSVGSAPALTVSTTSLSGFTYMYTKGPTVQQSYTVSGTNLVGTVTVTPPTDYQISTTSGSGYVSTPITLTPTSGTLSSTTIYVIMPAGLGVGSHNQNISITATGATTKTVSLTGTVTAAPTLTTATSYLGGFIYTLGAGPSGEQSFVLNGSNLSTSLLNDTITAPANFEISTTSGSGFTTGSIILTRGAGVTTQTRTIYVRMVTALAVGNYGPGNVSLKSSNAIVKSVALVGSVVNSATLLTSATTLTGFGYMQGNGPSSEQKFTVSGGSLTASISVSAPTNYEISTTSGTGFQS
ncbi:MAG: hypothetical protein WCQ44_12580, partial [Opitutaceae bacterium]